MSWEETVAGGDTHHPFGVDVEGIITYTADGHVSTHIHPAQRARFANDDFRVATDTEMTTAWPAYFGYFGTYSVDTNSRLVTHRVEGAWFPNLVGTDQARQYTLDGASLTLEGPLPGGTSRVTWQRATGPR